MKTSEGGHNYELATPSASFQLENTMTTFLKTKQTRQRLDRPFIVRLAPELYDRLETAVASIPALSGISKSEFVRRAMVYALESVESEMGANRR